MKYFLVFCLVVITACVSWVACTYLDHEVRLELVNQSNAPISEVRMEYKSGDAAGAFVNRDELAPGESESFVFFVEDHAGFSIETHGKDRSITKAGVIGVAPGDRVVATAAGGKLTTETNYLFNWTKYCGIRACALVLSH